MNWTWLTDPKVVVGAVLAFTTTASGIAHVVIKALAKRAATTPGTDDDEKYARWLDRIDTVMFIADVVRRMPRVIMGPFPATQPIASVAGGSLAPMKPLSVPPARSMPRPEVPTIPTQTLVTPPPADEPKGLK